MREDGYRPTMAKKSVVQSVDIVELFNDLKVALEAWGPWAESPEAVNLAFNYFDVGLTAYNSVALAGANEVPMREDGRKLEQVAPPVTQKAGLLKPKKEPDKMPFWPKNLKKTAIKKLPVLDIGGGIMGIAL